VYTIDVDQARLAARQPLVIERRGTYRALSAEEWHAQFEAIDRFAGHFEAVSAEELETEIADALAAVRAEEPITPRGD
jgi:hypothetical protein